MDGVGSSSDGRSAGAAARRGARATLVSQLLTQAGSVLATLILARVLTPTEFGLVALTQSLMGVGSLLSVAGVTASLVTYRGNVDRLASTYFWGVSGVAVGVAGAVALVAGPLTSLAGLPEAHAYLVVLALGFPFTLVALVPQALLQRRMAFTRFSAATLMAAVTYFSTEVVLALLGLGAWAVIIGSVAGAVSSLGLSLALTGWIPRYGFSMSHLREELRFMSGVTLDQALAYLHKNVDYWGVSRVLGAAPLGTYYLAYVIPNILRARISGVFRVVMLPILSGAPETSVGDARWRRAVSLTLFLGAPLFTGIATVAGPLTSLFFGSQWGSTLVAPMRILILGSIVDLLVQAVATLAVSRRRIAGHLSVMVIRLAMTVAAVTAALMLVGTLTAVAWAVVASTFATLVLQVPLVCLPLGVGLRKLAVPLALIGISCSAMALACAIVVESLRSQPELLQLLVTGTVGVGVYLVAGLLLGRSMTSDMIRQCLQLSRGGSGRADLPHGR